jgi:phytoene dehydrogenase-like protein
MLERVAAVVEPTLTMAPPDVLKPRAGDLRTLFSLGRSVRRLGSGVGEAAEILTCAARPILDRWFESEELKGTLATDAIIGAMASPSMPGTVYVLFHHVMGEAGATRGVWAYMRGGMGGITQALAAAALDLGVDIRCDAEVARILVRDGRADGTSRRCRGRSRGRSTAGRFTSAPTRTTSSVRSMTPSTADPRPSP